MDFQSMMETFAEAWVAANTQTPLTEAAEQGLLLNSSLALGGQSLDMAFDTTCGRRSARDSSSSSLAMAQSSSQSSQQTTIVADDESASPLTACPSFGAQTDFKSGIPSNNTLGRTSIPIHCIVERVAAPGNASQACSSSSTSGGSGGTAVGGIAGSQSQPQQTHSLSQQSSTTAISAVTSSIASLPLPVTTSSSSIESLSSSSVSISSPIIEQDSYAIISSAVLFIDLVRTALLRLGYSASETVGAKGVIQIKNWKPLTFEQITDNVEATVGDILGDIASVSTLKIRLYRPRLNAAHELKDKLLQVLLAHSYSLLVNSGCPIDQQILTGLCRGRVEQEIPDDTRRRFDQWYLQQVFNHYRQIAIAAQQQQQQQQQHQSTSRRTPTHPLLVDLNSSTGEHIHANTGNNGTHSPEKHPALLTISSPQNNQHQHQHITSVRTRIRTSFDPELELPKLHRWFSENRHPSRAQVQEYVKELNSLESRKGRKPLDINNVVYWFKNARAAHKRAELKFVGDSNAANDMVNGSHSPCKTGSDTSGKCNEESTRNGSAIDDYYSLDDGDSGESSHEATQTLDLSMRAAKKSRSESPVSNDFSINFIKHEEEAQSDNNTNNIGIKSEPLDRNDGSSDYNSVDDSDDDKEYFDNINTFPQINVNTNNNSSQPESPDGRRIRRSRTFIDPMSEVPRLEHWFSMNTHPAHSQIVRYTEELNSLPYRQKFPKLEPKNIQFWFKNRRAKFKRNLTVPSSQIHCQPSSSLNIERLIAH